MGGKPFDNPTTAWLGIWCKGFDSVRIGPGKVIALGGPPSYGKTCLVNQWTFDAIGNNPHLRAVVCNVEMSPFMLLERELCRSSGVPFTSIQDRSFRTNPTMLDKVKQSIKQLAAIADRIHFVLPPFTLESVAASADDMGAE